MIDFVEALEKNGFPVAPIGYFYVCNAKSEVAGFSGIMEFEEILIPYTLDYSWVEPQIFNMLNLYRQAALNPSILGSALSCLGERIRIFFPYQIG